MYLVLREQFEDFCCSFSVPAGNDVNFLLSARYIFLVERGVGRLFALATFIVGRPHLAVAWAFSSFENEHIMCLFSERRRDH